ncbi:MAG: class I SAM-dependent methyltransferase [Acidimicrobiia bacterium]
MVIPFYGVDNREMFEIEREAMDRRGRVIEALNTFLPDEGVVLDIGAGDGFTGQRLATTRRTVVGVEPAAGMIDSTVSLEWVQGVAQSLPFRERVFDGAYATWSYFFPSIIDVTPGFEEVDRVTKPGAPIVIVDNAGDDEFTAMAHKDISVDLDFWRRAGFAIDIVETAFVFNSIDDARLLLEFFFGDRAKPALEVEYRAAVMSRNRSPL